jgi:hypothetical protein
MKTLLLAFFALFFGHVHAQTVVEKSVVCIDTPNLFKALSGSEIGEKPQWAGRSDEEDSNFILFVNTKTKFWTLVQFNDKVGCILGTGSRSTEAKVITAKQ